MTVKLSILTYCRRGIQRILERRSQLCKGSMGTSK